MKTRAEHYQKLGDAEQRRIDAEKGRTRPETSRNPCADHTPQLDGTGPPRSRTDRDSHR